MESRFLNHIREHYIQNRTNLIELDEDSVPQHVLTYVNSNYDSVIQDNNINNTSEEPIMDTTLRESTAESNNNTKSFNDSVTSLDRQSEVDLIMLYERNDLGDSSDSESTYSNFDNNNDLESISSNIEGFIRSRQNSNGIILTNPDGIVTNDNLSELINRRYTYAEQTLFNRVEVETFHPAVLDLFDITRFDLSSRLREYILTLRNFDISSESSISQQIQLYTNHINSMPMPEMIMHKIMSCYFNFTVNDWMDREIHHGVDFFDYSNYVIEFVDNLALVLANT